MLLNMDQVNFTVAMSSLYQVVVDELHDLDNMELHFLRRFQDKARISDDQG